MDTDAFGQKRWTPKAEDMWEDKLAGNRKAAQDEGGTYRLFKARWQGYELARDEVVKTLARTLEPIGEVDVEAALLSEMFDCVGLAPNRQEPMEGAGGGCYVPTRMRDITGDWTPEQETAIKELWDGTMPMGSGDHEETGLRSRRLQSRSYGVGLCQWGLGTMALAMVSGTGTAQLSTSP